MWGCNFKKGTILGGSRFFARGIRISPLLRFVHYFPSVRHSSSWLRRLPISDAVPHLVGLQSRIRVSHAPFAGPRAVRGRQVPSELATASVGTVGPWFEVLAARPASSPRTLSERSALFLLVASAPNFRCGTTSHGASIAHQGVPCPICWTPGSERAPSAL